MKSVVYAKYGSAEVLEIAEIPIPTITNNQVLVKVNAVSINPADWHFMRGTPYLVRLQSGLLKPKIGKFGLDMAGVVESVGANVTEFKVGDEVFGESMGALSEFAVFSQNSIATKPASLNFEEAAAVPMAGFTAIQALRDKAGVKSGDRVLIVGASGGVGSFAVQIAKAFGANVTGVCSTGNVEMVKSIGADRVIDYTKEDFFNDTDKYDVIVQTAGNYTLKQLRAALASDGTLVQAGDSSGVKAVFGMGFVFGMLKTLVISMLTKQKMPPFLAKRSKADLIALTGLIESGKLRPVIDRKYPLAQVAQAVTYLEAGHARGKVVITL
jgi:NADPH:quinone reductase-like Zn-dependent oxidoreductase